MDAGEKEQQLAADVAALILPTLRDEIVRPLALDQKGQWDSADVALYSG